MQAWETKDMRSVLPDFLRRHSSYLARLIDQHPETVAIFFENGPDAALAQAMSAEEALPIAARWRKRKQKVALITAMADIAELWPLRKITATLSAFAEGALNAALDHLLSQARDARLIERTIDHGIFILGMGKLGAEELNYSSDIDLIVLFDAETLPYIGRQSPQAFMTRLTQELVSLMQDRTAEGYIFRTDLRLRPDPGSTPLAVSTTASRRYYESVGQNWERAAMIKARVIAGDHAGGEHFLQEMQPFLWRNHLDFAAVADILSIKRQMQASHDETITAPGHNVKTGRGGIREIEFLCQIHQLIWGGRLHQLRRRPTIDVLHLLAVQKLIAEKTARRLERSYEFLRTVEHRLQMIADQQTHTLPQNDKEMAEIASFLRFASPQGFVRTVERHLRRVHRYFLAAFQEMEPLGGSGKLMFTGVDPDPETVAQLLGMGFRDAVSIAQTIADWHKGHRRCTRTNRSRELLTELVPEILAALAETAEPDRAFLHFDQFLTHLPSGVQLFSLFASNRQLLRLTADLLGSAPALGRTLSQNPVLFDAVLTGGFFDPLATAGELRVERGFRVAPGRNEEDRLLLLRAFQQERMFQAGVHLLKNISDAVRIGQFLSDLADSVLEWIVGEATGEFEAAHGVFPGGGLALIAMGKLGSQELSFGSDLDLIFLYQAGGHLLSDGAKPLGPPVYFNRLAQRILGRITAASRLGRFYEVDTRLRPFGADGPIAASLEAFARYYAESAWMFERLALTRARPVAVDRIKAETMASAIAEQLARPFPDIEIARAIGDMRARLAERREAASPWDIKHVPGGLMDVDFILQYHVLKHLRDYPDLIAMRWPQIFAFLHARGVISGEAAARLESARALETTLLFCLRLMSDGTLDEAQASLSLKQLLARACGEASFETLRRHLTFLEQFASWEVGRLSLAN